MLYYWYSLAIFVSLHIPRSISYKIATCAAYLVYLFNGKLRRTISLHINSFIQSTQSSQDANQLTKETLVNFFKYLVDFFRVPLLTQEYISENIPIYGKENLDNAIAAGKKIVILAGHIGNWELGAIATSKLGYRITSLALDHPNPRVNQLFLNRRKSAGMQVYPLNLAGIRKCYKALDSGRIIGLMGDLEFGSGGVELDWFGEKVRVPKGPAMIARRIGAVVIPGVMIRQQDDRLVIYFDSPIEPEITNNPESDILNNTQRYLTALGKYIQQYPNQWYRFR